MADVTVKVMWPYGSYDFGGGLPIIYSTPTTITDVQLDAIVAILATIPLSSRPKIVDAEGEVGGGTGSGPSGPIVANDITDATSIGKQVLVAATQAIARAAIGAGTSDFDGTWASLTGDPPDLGGGGTIIDSPDDIGAQPVSTVLTELATLTPTAYGEAFLELANQAALMALLSAATTSASGVVELATNTEATTGTDTARAVTPAGLKAAVDAAVANLINSAPGALDTLGEIATQLAADESGVAALTTTVSGKAAKSANLSDLTNLATALANLGGVPTSRTIAGKALTANITLAKADVGLDQVDNVADVDKLASDDVQTQLDGKAPDSHTHDTRYYQSSQTSGIHVWATGDPVPGWVAGGVRPAGVIEMIVLNDGDSVPTWKAAQDFVLIKTTEEVTIPEIRSFGGFTALSSDAGSITQTFPPDVADGDTCWLFVSTTGAAPTTPTAVGLIGRAGWAVEEAFLSSGASNSDGLILYRLDVGAGEAASLASQAQVVAQSTTTSGLGTIICWNGLVDVESVATGVDDANTSTNQSFPTLTPGAASRIVGAGAVRYNTLSGGTNIGTRTGWTELFDRSTAKAGAPQRGLVVSTMDADGESGVATGVATGVSPGPVLRTANMTLAVVRG